MCTFGGGAWSLRYINYISKVFVFLNRIRFSCVRFWLSSVDYPSLCENSLWENLRERKHDLQIIGRCTEIKQHGRGKM